MRRYLNAFLIVKLLITLVTGHLLFTPEPYVYGGFSISDLFLHTESTSLHNNQVLGVYTTNPTNKMALSGCESLDTNKKEAIKCQIREIAKDSVVDWRHLYVLAKYESTLNPEATNINHYEESYGLFQINIKAHPHITIKQAKDVKFATQWTIENLIKNGYANGYITYSIGRHQGGWHIPRVQRRARQIVYEAQKIN